MHAANDNQDAERLRALVAAARRVARFAFFALGVGFGVGFVCAVVALTLGGPLAACAVAALSGS